VPSPTGFTASNIPFAILPCTLKVYSTSESVSSSHSKVAATPRGVCSAASISALVYVLDDEGVIPASESHLIGVSQLDLLPCIFPHNLSPRSIGKEGKTRAYLESWQSLEKRDYLGEEIYYFFLGNVVGETTRFERRVTSSVLSLILASALSKRKEAFANEVSQL